MENELMVMAKGKSLSEILKTSGKEIFYKSILDIVNNVLLVSGRKMEKEEIKTLTGITCQELVQTYPYLSGKEIRYLFGQGVRGRYGEYFNISLYTFIGWIDAYLESDEREKVVAEKRKITPASHQLAETNRPSEADQAEMTRGLINKSYAEYLETNVMPVAISSTLNKVITQLRLERLVADGKAKPGETLKDVYQRYKAEGAQTIY